MLTATLDLIRSIATRSVPESPKMAKTIGDDLLAYESTQADAKAKSDAAVAADKAASDAATLASSTATTTAADLHLVGPSFSADGSKVYLSQDGQTVQTIVPKPPTTPVPTPGS